MRLDQAPRRQRARRSSTRIERAWQKVQAARRDTSRLFTRGAQIPLDLATSRRAAVAADVLCLLLGAVAVVRHRPATTTTFTYRVRAPDGGGSADARAAIIK